MIYVDMTVEMAWVQLPLSLVWPALQIVTRVMQIIEGASLAQITDIV